MDLHEIGNLLERIAIHYPAFEKQISKDGQMNRAVAEEWQRIIGFLSYEDAIARLDAWMEGDDHKKAPMAIDFKLVKPKRKDEAFHAPISHIWKIVRGELYDEEDRRYFVDPANYLPFYWNEDGIACQGKTQYRHIRRGGEHGKGTEQAITGETDTGVSAES